MTFYKSNISKALDEREQPVNQGYKQALESLNQGVIKLIRERRICSIFNIIEETSDDYIYGVGDDRVSLVIDKKQSVQIIENVDSIKIDRPFMYAHDIEAACLSLLSEMYCLIQDGIVILSSDAQYTICYSRGMFGVGILNLDRPEPGYSVKNTEFFGVKINKNGDSFSSKCKIEYPLDFFKEHTCLLPKI